VAASRPGPLTTVDRSGELRAARAVLADAAERAPASPGVYFLLGAAGELLYVGKAATLRKRLRQHVRGAAAPVGVRAAALLDRIAGVRWEECVEREAFIREADLIVLLRPPFNAAHTEQDPNLYVRLDPGPADTITFELARVLPAAGRGYGSFPHLAKGAFSRPAKATKAGYTALMRLLWAAQAGGRAGAIPSRVGGASPPLAHRTPVAPALRPALHDYLAGRSARLVDILDGRVRHAALPDHVRAGVLRDVAPAREFHELAPRRVRALRLRHGLPAGPLAAGLMAELVGGELRAAIGWD
jgi:hypothetical protein